MKPTIQILLRITFIIFSGLFINNSDACNVNSNFWFVRYSNNNLLIEFLATDSSASSYQWDFGDGTTGNKQIENHLYASSGTYTIQLITWDSAGNCSDTSHVTLSIYNCNVSANFNINDSLGTLSLTNTSSNASSYKWYFVQNGNMDSSTNFNVVKSYNACDSVKITLFASNGNCTVYQTKYWIPQTIVADFEIIPDTTQTYSGILIDKSRYSSSPYYLWYFGDGDTSNSQTPTHTYSGSGLYGLCLVLSNGNCTSYKCDTIGFDSTGQLNLAMKPFSLKVIKQGQTVSSIHTRKVSSFSVYPNPVNDKMHLIGTGIIKSIQVISSIGEVLINESINANETEIGLEKLISGFYTLVVEDNNGNRQLFTFIRL